MPTHIGERKSGGAITFWFNTSKADGTPITLAGSPAIKAYRDGSTAEFTTGPTLTVDHDGVTGLHRIDIVTTDLTAYPVGSDIAVYISAGTVDSVSVVGAALLTFSVGPIIRTTAVTGTLSTTQASIARTIAADAQMIGRRVVAITGSRKGEVAVITASVASTGVLTFAPALTGALANGDIIDIV